MAIPQPSLVIAPADIAEHWGIELGSSWHPGFQAMIETALERFV